MADLRVPKRPLRVELTVGAETLVATLFVTYGSGGRGAENLAAVFGQEKFVPADDGNGCVRLVNVDSIVVARVQPEEDRGSVNIRGFVPGTERDVELSLAGGGILRGRVRYRLPAQDSRLNDYLNEPEAFLRLIEGKSVALVNKRHIAWISEVPPPSAQ